MPYRTCNAFRRGLSMVPAVAMAMSLSLGAAHAQDLPVGATVTSTALTGFAQFDTDLDSGGRFSWSGGIASASLLHQFAPNIAAGISVQYDYQSYRFDSPTAFGGMSPWRNVQQPQIGATFIFAPSEDWTIMVAPSVAWAYESGASTTDALEYGAVLAVTKDFSPTLSVGLGAAVFRQIYETQTFPFLAIDWQIDKNWRLTNPFAAGPTGPAGLELSYKFDDGTWEAGFGGSYRSYAFRLDENGPVPDGIGEQRFIPVFVRLSRNLGPKAQVDIYATGLANGRLNVKNRNADDIVAEDYSLAPALAVTLRYRF